VADLNGEAQGMTARDYVRVLLRRLWLIVLIAAVAAGAAFYLSVLQTKMYQATAKIIYAPQLSTQATGQAAIDPYGQQDALQSVATSINNPVLQKRTAALVGQQAPGPAAYKLTAQSEGTATATNLVNAVVDITATSSAPRTAQVAANAYAASFIAVRKQTQVAQLSNALDTLKGQMATFTTAAAKESSSYLLLTQTAQSLEVRMATATGDFSVAVPATLPISPYKPRPLRNAILGLGVSLFVAIGLVFLLEQFDTKPRSHREVSEILGLSVVGRVPRIDRKAIAADPLAGVHNASGAAAESLRLLRSNLDYLDVDGALSTVLITSCLPGEGKSVTVCNLGVTLAMGGHRVVIIDADLRRPSVHHYMGLQNTTGLSSVVAGKVPLVEALQGYNLPPLDWSSNGGGHNGNGSKPSVGAANATVATGAANAAGASAAAASAPIAATSEKRKLYVLTSGPLPPNPGEIVASKRFEAVLAELKSAKIDFVLIDTPAFGSVSDAAAIAPHVDGVLALVNMDGATRPMLTEAREFLDQLPTRKLGVIIVREKITRSGYHHSYYAYSSRA
jgi:Mrp family chromosome partitioning ATPase